MEFNFQKDLLAFEDLVFTGKLPEAFEKLMFLLTVITAKINGKEWHFKGNQREVREIYTRLAAGMTTLIANPAMEIKMPEFLGLCARSEAISNVYIASGYGGPGVLFTALSRIDKSGARTMNSRDQSCLFPMLDLDHMPEKIFALAMRLPDHLLFPLGMAWLQHQILLTEQGEDKRTRLLAKLSQMEPSVYRPELLLAVARVWMFCSYASSPSKHAIKRTLNRMLVHSMENQGIKPVCKTSRDRTHPTMLVVGERFISTHAMYRSFAPILRALSQKFQLSLIVERGNYDDKAKNIFKKIIEIPVNGGELSKNIQSIAAISPDMIYYPSVGMSAWAIQLANLRLAPIQLMQGGHPASSMSDHMDYFMMPRGFKPINQIYSEKVVWLKSDAIYAEHPALTKNFESKFRANSLCINIAVNAKVMKISSRLLDVCEKLICHTTKKLCFHFFPGVSAGQFDQFSLQLKERFNNAVVYKIYEYDEFLSNLNKCDISLAAFPFGNDNSTVDAMLLEIPVVAYCGEQLHSQSDARVINQLGLPTWLINYDDESYFETALRLIEDDNLRRSVVDLIKSSNVRDKLFSAEATTFSSDIVNTFTWIYENHESIQNSGEWVLETGKVI